MRKSLKKRYKSYAIVYTENEEVGKEIFKIYSSKGFSVMMSGSQIGTGTHGMMAVKKIDIMTELTEEEYALDYIINKTILDSL